MTWRERLEIDVEGSWPFYIKLFVAERQMQLTGLAEVLERVEAALETATLAKDGKLFHRSHCAQIDEALTALSEWRDGISNGKGEVK